MWVFPTLIAVCQQLEALQGQLVETECAPLFGLGVTWWINLTCCVMPLESVLSYMFATVLCCSLCLCAQWVLSAGGIIADGEEEGVVEVSGLITCHPLLLMFYHTCLRMTFVHHALQLLA
jgi:hypothetical protein